MTAPYRIRRPEQRARDLAPTAAPPAQQDFKYYLERLLKMIPGEVIGLYLIGQGLIPADQGIVMAVWAALCLAGVVAVRAYGTADPEQHAAPDWAHVGISSVAFAIWVYTLGGPFEVWGIAVPYIGSLLVLAWTFFVPIFYKGPPA
jgi:hypothetical protein